MDLLNTIVCDTLIAGLAALALYVNIADRRRRARMTRAERRAEDRFEADHRVKW